MDGRCQFDVGSLDLHVEEQVPDFQHESSVDEGICSGGLGSGGYSYTLDFLKYRVSSAFFFVTATFLVAALYKVNFVLITR